MIFHQFKYRGQYISTVTHTSSSMSANLIPSETPITESRPPLKSLYPTNETLLPPPQTSTLKPK